MEYIDVSEIAKKWKVSERSVRNYCQLGRVPGAFTDRGVWMIPYDAVKPGRKQRKGKIPAELIPRLKLEKESGIPGGIYQKVQIEFTYNSNHMAGNILSHDQTRYIYETNTVETKDETVNVDDIVETVNHFRCIDLVIDQAGYALSEAFIKQLHYVLKSGTSDSRKPWFAVGDYKRIDNEAGGMATTRPAEVSGEMKSLISNYNTSKDKKLLDIIEFHCRFEKIHPFQDCNGRIGRLIMFKECLRNNITPFFIEDDLKVFYYKGLKEWKYDRTYLMDTVYTSQDRFKAYMDYFGIKCTK